MKRLCGPSAPQGGKIMRTIGFRGFRSRVSDLVVDDDGMSTAEYAIGTIAAAAFGAVLYAVVTGDSIVSALTGIVERALNTAV